MNIIHKINRLGYGDSGLTVLANLSSYTANDWEWMSNSFWHFIMGIIYRFKHDTPCIARSEALRDH